MNQSRDLSLGITDDATYRLQIQSSASQVFFSYLPVDVELKLTCPLDVNPRETDLKRSLEADNGPAGALEDVVALEAASSKLSPFRCIETTICLTSIGHGLPHWLGCAASALSIPLGGRTGGRFV